MLPSTRPFAPSRWISDGPSASSKTLQGPKIWIGTLEDGGMTLDEGEKIRFVLGGTEGNGMLIPLPRPKIFEAILPGQDLLIDDGRVWVKARGSWRCIYRSPSREAGRDQH